MEQEMMNDVAENLPETAPEKETGEEIAASEPNGAEEADELSALRDALAEKEQLLADMTAKQERYAAEFAEFRKEFPDVPLGRVTDAVWDEVKKGVPLCAAYALAEHRAAKAARMSGHEAGTWHSLSGGTDEGLFSPAEVRAMTQYEVRRNYDRILESMKRW